MAGARKLSCMIAAAALVLASAGRAADDRIISLPGYSGPNLTQYAGYLTGVNATRQLFYWFIEATAVDPATAPVVMWTNGGPGCSSLGGGLFTELGPFRPDTASDGLVYNPYTWNQYANIIYLEHPVGVGFSYDDDSSYAIGDADDAADNYAALQNFFAEYPQFRGNEFWITGESYGGHYVPNLAAKIVSENKNASNPTINFAGFQVGNAWTYSQYDNTGAATYWFDHAMIANETYNGLIATCNMSDVGPLLARRAALGTTEAVTTRAHGFTLAPGALGFKSQHPVADARGRWALPTFRAAGYEAQTCDDWQNEAFSEMGNVNIYDIFVNVCANGASRGASATARLTPTGGAATGDSNTAGGCAADYDPCADDRTQAYLNRADVQSAIHAKATAWTDCSQVVQYSYPDLLSSMLPVYQYLLSEAPKARYLVYSGDVDAIVPVTGTRFWLAALNLPVVNKWRSYTVDGQVGGWTVDYSGLTLATVRNAGHMVPQTQEARSLYLFKQFLDNQPL